MVSAGASGPPRRAPSMTKYLLVALVGLIFYFLLRSPPARPTRSDGVRTRAATSSGEEMVECEQCGVHLPRSESLMSRGAFYCSEEHRLLHQR